MFNCCTLSDYNYLLKGLVLYDSLIKYTKEDFVLYYLCLDQKTFDKLNELKLEKIRPINLKDLEYGSPLQVVKKQVTYQNYCFTLSSYFIWYLLKNYNLKDILYIDSDIVFYDSLKRVFDTVKNSSIGIIRHRHVPYGHWVGAYNVGIVYFRNDERGMECVKFWRDLMLNPNNRYSKEYGTTGDQKYLELLYLQYKDDIKIIDESIQYAAPYNLDLFNFLNFNINNKKVKWENIDDKLIFCHFIKFTPYFNIDKYKAVETQQEWDKLSQINAVKQLYDEYYQLNKEIYSKYLTN